MAIENDLYRVEISNQGAVVTSWKLKKYTDDTKPPEKCRDGTAPPCVLDVVHQQASEQTGGWPFALILDNEELQNAANGGLYQVSTAASTLYGTVIRTLRGFTAKTADEEPKWRKRGNELLTGYQKNW